MAACLSTNPRLLFKTVKLNSPALTRKSRVFPSRRSMVRSNAEGTNVKSQSSVKKERQLTSEEHWAWHAPHIRHWHGEWKIWKPVEGDALQKSFRSVRSFQFKDDEKSAFDHVNDWYEEKGDLTMTPLSGVTWEITRQDHSLPDGIMHPARPSHRVLCVNPKGEGAWVQQQFKGPQEGLYLEVFFSNGPEAQLSVPFGFDAKGTFLASLIVEDSADSKERPDPAWKSQAWASPVPDVLPKEFPSFISTDQIAGIEQKITPELVASESIALWDGYCRRIADDDVVEYTLIAIPLGIVLCVPRSLHLVVGKPFSMSATWHVSRHEVTRVMASYSESGELLELSRGDYTH
ncbi:hypothetical protein CLOM_g13484 [Closterium sp. NIES-68]|nr:hypothetical protein CLOM_g13484 [Closterium sp. NIES-68]GJP59724.1 hypothetical protein CLOP_g15099 [Closterium sp. NIES-67]